MTEALGDAACGCDLAERAAAETDPRGAEILARDAAACRAEWRCPLAGGRVGAEDLPAPQRAALERVSRLCGAEDGELRACPGYYPRRPEAHRAVVLLRWLRAGALALRCPHPTGAEVDALDLVQDSLAARERDELERAKRKEPDRGR